jgi:hypothetical protein
MCFGKRIEPSGEKPDLTKLHPMKPEDRLKPGETVAVFIPRLKRERGPSRGNEAQLDRKVSD